MCSEPPAPIEAYKSADAVFVGTVLSGNPEGDDSKRYVFEVVESLKGRMGQRVEVVSNRSSGTCGFRFQDGGRYLVYANLNQGTLWTSDCHRTKDYDRPGFYRRGEFKTGKEEAEELKATLRLESVCASYHLAHHQEDEQDADTVGCVEFNGYKVSVEHITNGEAVVGIKVTSQKRVDLHCGWTSTKQNADWQERWRSTTNGWVIVERLSQPVGIKIIR
jgi:hypothetical protein